MGWLKAFIRGLKYAEFQGDVNQQGASIIVGPGASQFLIVSSVCKILTNYDTRCQEDVYTCVQCSLKETPKSVSLKF